MQYGYMDIPVSNVPAEPRSANLMSQDSLRTFIKEFQSFAGLPQTGDLDTETREMMNRPRCGVKDMVGHTSTKRRKRYALQGSRWKVKTINYRISKYPRSSSMSDSDVDREIARALQVVSPYSHDIFTNTHISGLGGGD